jgi:hypothetical protein
MPLNNTPNIVPLTNLTINNPIGISIGTVPTGVGGLPSAQVAPSTIQTPLGQVINSPAAVVNTPQITTYFSASQAFAMTATGLKPSTVHTFAFDGVDVTAQCQQSGALKGGGLITDSTGSLNFTFYYSSGLPTSSTDVTASQDMVNRLAGKKNGVITNADGTSSAIVTINIIPGTIATYTPPVPAPVTADLTGLTTTTNNSVSNTSVGTSVLGGGFSLNIGNLNLNLS